MLLSTSVAPSAPELDLDLSGPWYEPALLVLVLFAIAGAVTVLIAVCASHFRDCLRKARRLDSFDESQGCRSYSANSESSRGPGRAPRRNEDDGQVGPDRPTA